MRSLLIPGVSRVVYNIKYLYVIYIYIKIYIQYIKTNSLQLTAGQQKDVGIPKKNQSIKNTASHTCWRMS